VRRIADSTVRRLSLYLRFLEESSQRGLVTISSDELARRGGTTSAQVRKDLSFFGSFGKRGLGYSVPELTESLREILGLRHDWQVIIVGAGKITLTSPSSRRRPRKPRVSSTGSSAQAFARCSTSPQCRFRFRPTSRSRP
jgi:hypothetical protein